MVASRQVADRDGISSVASHYSGLSLPRRTDARPIQRPDPLRAKHVAGVALDVPYHAARSVVLLDTSSRPERDEGVVTRQVLGAAAQGGDHARIGAVGAERSRRVGATRSPSSRPWAARVGAAAARKQSVT